MQERTCAGHTQARRHVVQVKVFTQCELAAYRRERERLKEGERRERERGRAGEERQERIKEQKSLHKVGYRR
jgi:hypothetical protein